MYDDFAANLIFRTDLPAFMLYLLVNLKGSGHQYGDYLLNLGHQHRTPRRTGGCNFVPCQLKLHLHVASVVYHINSQSTRTCAFFAGL